MNAMVLLNQNLKDMALQKELLNKAIELALKHVKFENLKSPSVKWKASLYMAHNDVAYLTWYRLGSDKLHTYDVSVYGEVSLTDDREERLAFLNARQLQLDRYSGSQHKKSIEGLLKYSETLTLILLEASFEKGEDCLKFVRSVRELMNELYLDVEPNTETDVEH
jgi:hypothetical protein